jgi:hypothetical protein
VADEEPSSLASLEADVAEGLARRDQWHRAQAASDPSVKLDLLRPFLIPGGEHHFTNYEVLMACDLVLQEVENAGPQGVPFLTNLLTLPYYHDDYAPNGWSGFGSHLRTDVKISLVLQQSRAATQPEEKLSRLRPLFGVPYFNTSAGSDPEASLYTFMDRALAAAEAAGPKDALPFLRGLLELPQFQEGYSPPTLQGYGHDERAKIQAAIASMGN